MIELDKLNTPILFRSQPETIPGDLRPLWRISILILMLHLASRGGRASLSKLHVLNWAVRSNENRKRLMDVINKMRDPGIIYVRIDPSLNRAMDFACGEGLTEYITGSRIRLTPRGSIVAKKILENEKLFVNEVCFLKEISKNSLTERLINRLFKEG